MLFPILYLVTCFIISYAWGEKKRIGFGWSLFFCLFWTPFGGIIVISQSPDNDWYKYEWDDQYKNDGIKGIGLIVVSIFFLAKFIDKAYNNDAIYGGLSEESYNLVFNDNLVTKNIIWLNAVIAFCGSGIYFLNRHKRHQKIYSNPPKERVQVVSSFDNQTKSLEKNGDKIKLIIIYGSCIILVVLLVIAIIKNGV